MLSKGGGVAVRIVIALAVLALAAGGGQARAAQPGERPLRITLELAPRHPALLERMAAASSGRPPLSPQRVAALFAPRSQDVARVEAAMAGRGLKPVARRGLSLTFEAAADTAARTFGPRAAPTDLPGSIAGLVTDVEGPGSTPAPQPLTAPAGPAVVPSCPGPVNLQADEGGYLPKQLALSQGYNFQQLLKAGYDGTGQTLAVVEFSNYDPADVAAYQSCFGLSVPVTDVPVDGGTPIRSDALEVAIDLEVALSAAPGLDHAYAYIAPPTGSMAQVLNAIVADRAQTGVGLISISWGLCERQTTPSRAVATGQALQLAAVSGITVVAGSGDAGSMDCGEAPRAVDDPASQPFATGVGGTTLRTELQGAEREIAWNNIYGATGGGISRNWQRPSWQTGPGVIGADSSGAPCVAVSGVCREVPDISLSASPGRRGYIVFCRAGASCANRGWQTAGGTSASAPLMAGIVADMNEYSLAHGGSALGFASPFLYETAAADPDTFRDVVLGDNSPRGFAGFAAGPGYDMVSGLGTPRVHHLAAALAAYTPAPPVPLPTTLALDSVAPRAIHYGRPVSFSGRLTDAGGGVVGMRVWITGFDGLHERRWPGVTDAHGDWTVTVHSGISRLTHWAAAFLGDESERPSHANGSVVRVIPPLIASSRLPSHDGVYQAQQGVPFLFVAHALSAMAGRILVLEARPGPGAGWQRVAAARIGLRGYATHVLRFLQPGHRQLRWRYKGSPTGPWLSALSEPRGVSVS